MKSLHRTVVSTFSLLALTAPAFSQVSHPPQAILFPPMPTAQTQWVATSLKEMEQIKVGMTRAQLLKFFTVEGGLSSRSDQVYVFRNCEYFKVRVHFQTVGKDTGYRGNLNDRIMSISEPFLQWAVID